MSIEERLSAAERTELAERGVDIDISLSILHDYNQGRAGHNPDIVPVDVPLIDGKRVVDISHSRTFDFTADELQAFERSYPEASRHLNPSDEGKVSREELEKAGIELMPCFAYGFLNGGSATSYGDTKKNRGFHEELYRAFEEEFLKQSEKVKGEPKGVTPSFLQPDGAEGPSYMELKLRSLLLQARAYNSLTGKKLSGNIPFFQMTSVGNNSSVQDALEKYRDSPWLKELASSLGLAPWKGETSIQPLVTAYTHSSEGEKKRIHRPFITIPGGHGQCFRVLKELWTSLYDRGIRFISLGNIDNLGYTPDPLELALLAVRNSPAGFDESFKTEVDIKGGILVIDDGGKLNCADLGVGISTEDAQALEASGKKVLFNCGSGLFNLKWLLDNIDRIIDDLPLRFSDQNKDAGLYSQAEQVTWEVISMIENPLIFAVDKYRRFLAAKILLENMMTSGYKMDDPSFTEGFKDKKLLENAGRLHRGLQDILKNRYGLRLENNRWIPEESEGK